MSRQLPEPIASLLNSLHFGHAVLAGDVPELREVIAGARIGDLIIYDSAARERMSWFDGPARVPVPVDLRAASAEALGVISFDASGHLREAAVRELANRPARDSLPFLLLRANDWVRPVGLIATAAALRMATLANAAVILRCLPLIDRLSRQGRADHYPVVHAMLTALRQPAARPALIEGMAGEDQETRRFAFWLLAEQPEDVDFRLLIDALGNRDTYIRWAAAKRLRSWPDGDQLNHALAAMAKNPFMPVRREAIAAFVEHRPAEAMGRLLAGLEDGHSSIREFCRWHLRQRCVSDFGAIYRDRLREHGAALPAAIAGVGETGDPSDATLLAAFLEDPHPKTRLHAVRAIAKLDLRTHCDAVIERVRDPAPGVAKAAADGLAQQPFLIDRAKAAELFGEANPPHTRRQALRLIGALPWWDSAALLIDATAAADEALGTRAAGFLRRWWANVHRLSSKPTNDQLRRLEAALAANGGHLDEPTRRDVQDHLDYALSHR